MQLDDRLRLRLELEELYADYASALDCGEFDDWQDLFTEDCVYKIIPRENYDQGLPLATMLCESKAMLKDRLYAVRETAMYGPRSLRHLVSAVRVRSADAETVAAEANFCVLQTLNDEFTQVFMAGRYIDRLVRQGGRLRFTEKLCVFDTNLVPNSLVIPL